MCTYIPKKESQQHSNTRQNKVLWVQSKKIGPRSSTLDKHKLIAALTDGCKIVCIYSILSKERCIGSHIEPFSSLKKNQYGSRKVALWIRINTYYFSPTRECCNQFMFTYMFDKMICCLKKIHTFVYISQYIYFLFILYKCKPLADNKNVMWTHPRFCVFNPLLVYKVPWI